MADIVERLTWLSSRHAEHMNDGPRLTDFCHAGREAASVITALRAEVESARQYMAKRDAELLDVKAETERLTAKAQNKKLREDVAALIKQLDTIEHEQDDALIDEIAKRHNIKRIHQ